MGEAALREALQHEFAGGLASFPVTTAFSTRLSTAADLDRVTMRKIAVALLIVTLGSGCAGVNRQVRKAIGDREPKLWFAVVVWGAAIAGALATKNSYWCVRDRFRPNAYCDGGAWNPYGP